MADSEVVGIKIEVDEANLNNAAKAVKDAVSGIRTTVESEMRAVSDAISNIPAAGIEELAGKLNSLKAAIGDMNVSKNLTESMKAIKSLADIKDTTALEKVTTMLSELQSKTGGNGLEKTSRDIKQVKEEADKAAESISNMAQQVSATADSSGLGFFGRLKEKIIKATDELTSDPYEKAESEQERKSTERATEALREKNKVQKETNELYRSLSTTIQQFTGALSQLQSVLDKVAQKHRTAGKAAKEQTVDIEELKNRISTVASDKSIGKQSVAWITNTINDINTAMRSIGVDRETEQWFANIKQSLTDIRKLRESATSVKEAGKESNAEKELNQLYTERLRLLGQLNSAGRTIEVSLAKNNTSTVETENYFSAIKKQIDELDAKIAEAKGRLGDLGSSATKVFDEKTILAEAKAASQLAEALNKVSMAKQKLEQTDLSKAQTSVRSMYNQILQLGRLQESLFSTQGKFAAGSENYDKAAEGIKRIEERITTLRERIQELKSKYGESNFTDAEQQYAIKSTAQQVKIAEDAEKEKTSIAAREAAERRANEIHEAKLATEEAKRLRLEAAASNLDARTIATQTKTSTSQSKEEREIELQREREKEIARVREQIDALDKADKDYAENLTRLNAILTNLINKKSANAATTRTATAEEAREAVAIANNTKSLKDYINARQKLISAMSGMNSTSAEWQRLNALLADTTRNIDRIKQKMGELNSKAKETNTLASQLRNQFAALFSISAIKGFITKMVEVRAQFELQRIALGAIIQDVDRANDVFKEVQNMALESPFSIMQLERATKQIAAFGVEADKLKPSIKMLADISAGLGVDIDRLILVYGHIKANNALQQLHVRQFTNAGFNIAQNLADYFTEIEGKMVSVADVTDRIHKKMVTFADVEEVLRRVTSAGGMFYDMQKKQSDSLWGQMQRIKDQYDLMLNEIGQSSQNSISWVLTTIRALIKHWREFSNIVKGLSYVFAGWAAYKILFGVIASLGAKVVTVFKNLRAAIMLVNSEAKKGAAMATLFGTSWKAALVQTGVGLVVIAITSLIALLFKANGAAQQLNEELGRIGESQGQHLKESIANYLSLAETVKSSNKSYSEQEEALSELKRIYKDILPSYMLEREYLEKNTDAYKDATDAINKYYIAQEYNKKLTAIEQSEYYTKALEKMKEVGKKFMKEGVFDEYVTKDAVNKWMEVITKELAAGKLENSKAAIKKRMEELFEGHMDVSKIPDTDTGIKKVTKQIDKLIEAEGNLTLATLGGKNVQEDYAKSLESAPLDQLIARYKSLQKEIDTYKENIKKLQQITSSTQRSNIDEKIKDYEQKISDIQSRLLPELEEALSKRLVDEVQAGFEESFKNVEETIRLYAKLKTEKEELSKKKIQTEDDKEALKKVNEELVKAGASIRQLLPHIDEASLAFLDSADNAFTLEKGIKSLKEAFLAREFTATAPKFLSGINSHILDTLGKIEWLKKAINSISQTLFKKTVFTDVDETVITAAQEAQMKASEEAAEALSREEKVYQEAAKKYGVDLNRLTKYRKSDQEANSTYAKRLKDTAEEYEKTQAHFSSLAAEQKTAYLKEHSTTVQAIEDNAQMAKSLRYISEVYDETGANDAKNKKSGKDPILDLWKDRVKYIEDFFKRYKESLKNFSKEATDANVSESFKALFDVKGADGNSLSQMKGLNIADLIANNVDDKGLVEAFEKLKALIPSKYKDLIDDIQKKISDTSMTVGVSVQVEGLKNTQQQIDELFDSYELSKTIKDLGLNVEMVAMVGGKPTSLEDLQEKIDGVYKDMLKTQKVYGTEGEKSWDKYYEKVKSIENKALQERMKDYAKYMTTAYGERAKYQIDMYNQMTQMLGDFDKAALQNPQMADTYKQMAADAMRNMKKEIETKMGEFDFKDLMESDMFTEMFQDLSRISDKVLDSMLSKIREIRQTSENLSFSQLRQLAQYEEKIMAAKFDKGGITDYVKAIRDAAAARKAFGSREDIQVKLTTTQDQIDSQQKYLDDLNVAMAIDSKTYDIDENKANLSERQLEILKQQRVSLANGLDYIRMQKASTQENITAITKENKKLQEADDSQKSAAQAAQQMQNKIQAWGEVAQQAVGIASDAMTVFKGQLNEEDEAWIEFASNMVNMIVQLGIMFVALGVTITSALGIIGLIATAISTILGLVKTLLATHDSSLEKQISRLKDKIEDLERAYDKLSDAMDAAFDYSSYSMDYSKMRYNLNKQIQYYNEMIQLEKSKKNSDSSKIREYQQAIEDLRDELEELREQRITDLGGFGSSNYKSTVEDFVSSWVDAFKETGDGLDALKDKWSESIESMFVKQATINRAAKLYSKAMEIIDNAIDSGSTGFGLEEAISAAQRASDQAAEELNDYLKALAKVFGISSEGENTLSELQQGISNITESQAAAIEAYLNSIRFYVASDNEKVTELTTLIRSQYENVINPMLTVLKEIRDGISSFSDKFSAAFKNTGGSWKLQVC